MSHVLASVKRIASSCKFCNSSAAHQIPVFSPPTLLGEAKPGGFQTGGFPTFLGKVQIVSRTLSGLFFVGAVDRSRKRKRTNRENPRRVPEQIGKIPEKSTKSPKKDKKEGQVQIRKPPLLKPPRFSGLQHLGCSELFTPIGIASPPYQA